MKPCDAVLLIGFGGPENEAEIIPFLESVLKGRAVPRERFEEVAGHYRRMGGKSPYNELTLRQRDALQVYLKEQGIFLPVYVGMRTWRPWIKDVVREMFDRGIRRPLGIILAPHRCEASFERYLKCVEDAVIENKLSGFDIDYAGPWFDHPLFIEAIAERMRETLGKSEPLKSSETLFLFSAHSIPQSMADLSRYAAEIIETSRKVMLSFPDYRWEVVYQSRSGNPRDTWLGPDIGDRIRRLAENGVKTAMAVPAGFLCDHVEVLYDLDCEARDIADRCGIHFIRVPTVMDHPRFIAMLGDWVREKIGVSLL